MADLLSAILAIVGFATLAPRLQDDKVKPRVAHILEGVWVCFLLPIPIILLFKFPASLFVQMVVVVSIILHTTLLIAYWMRRVSGEQRNTDLPPR